MTMIDDRVTVVGSGADLLAQLRMLPPDDLVELLDQAAERDACAKLPTNTRLAYEQDWARWEEFTSTIGVGPLTIGTGVLAAFVEYLILEGKAPATIHRRLAGVVVGLRYRNVPVAPKTPAIIKATAQIKAYERRLAQNNIALSKQAPAVTISELTLMCTRMSPGLHALRDKALILIGVHVAGRSSELSGLLASDIEVHPDKGGMMVRIRVSKTGDGREVAVPYGANPATCPVLAWIAWRDAAELTIGPAFCQIGGRTVKTERAHPDKGITSKYAGQIVTRAGRLAGLALTGHSLRATFATIARALGYDLHKITKIAGWADGSVMPYRYDRTRLVWENDANVLGL